MPTQQIEALISSFELNWNFAAQSYIISFNSSPPVPQVGHFARITNSFFFDADESGLKTRHIKWIDFISH